MMFQVHENTTVKYLNRVYAGIRDEFITFYYLFLLPPQYFLLPTRHQAAGRGVCKAPLTTRYKCDNAAIPVALMLLLAPQNNDIKDNRFCDAK